MPCDLFNLNLIVYLKQCCADWFRTADCIYSHFTFLLRIPCNVFNFTCQSLAYLIFLHILKWWLMAAYPDVKMFVFISLCEMVCSVFVFSSYGYFVLALDPLLSSPSQTRYSDYSCKRKYKIICIKALAKWINIMHINT